MRNSALSASVPPGPFSLTTSDNAAAGFYFTEPRKAAVIPLLGQYSILLYFKKHAVKRPTNFTVSEVGHGLAG